MYSSPVLLVSWAIWRWLGIACANCNTIPERLNPSRDHLEQSAEAGHWTVEKRLLRQVRRTLLHMTISAKPCPRIPRSSKNGFFKEGGHASSKYQTRLLKRQHQAIFGCSCLFKLIAPVQSYLSVYGQLVIPSVQQLLALLHLAFPRRLHCQRTQCRGTS